MQVQIQATAISIPADDIVAAIPPAVLEGIRATNPTPFFQAYSIVQEGRSAPRVIGEGRRVLVWPRRAVEAVQGVIKKGLQFFRGHNADNSTAGRRSVGEVVASFSRTLGGALHQIAIGYFPDREAARDLDVCSIEADVAMQDAGEGMSVVDAITSLSGIALGNSRTDHPAFPGAVRLGSLQAFGPDDDPGKGKEKNTGGNPMTFDEARKTVKDLNIHPAQLYTLDEVRADRVFGPLLAEAEAHKKTIKDLQGEIQTRDTTISTLKKAEIAKGSMDRLSKILPEGLTEKQRTFITGRFKPEKMAEAELTEDGLKKFVEVAQADYADMAKLFGSTVPATGTTAGGNSDGGTPPPDGGSPVDQIVSAIKNT